MFNGCIICKFARLYNLKSNNQRFMSNDIRIKKGLDISLVGMAAKSISTAIKSNYYALRPEDFHGVTPKLIVKLGDKVNAGRYHIF